MTSKPVESRTDATARVTSAVVLWAWKRKARAVALEVGVSPTRGLTTPWRGRWRADVAFIVEGQAGKSAQVSIVEVKSSTADLRRETHFAKASTNDRRPNKWTIDLTRFGVQQWLAIDASVAVAHYAELPAHWGVLRVTAHAVKIERQAAGGMDASPMNEISAWKALAQIHSLQRLPKMAKVSSAAQVDLLQSEFGDRWTKFTKAILKARKQQKQKDST